MQPYEPGVGERLTDWFFDAVWPLVSGLVQLAIVIAVIIGLVRLISHIVP